MFFSSSIASRFLVFCSAAFTGFLDLVACLRLGGCARFAGFKLKKDYNYIEEIIFIVGSTKMLPTVVVVVLSTE